MVKSAVDKTDAIGPNAVSGLASSGAVRPVKWTSPAKARVSGPAAEGDVDGAGDADEGWNVADADEVQPAAEAITTRVRAAARGDFTATG
jgi:hypothetical protein